MKPFAIFLLLFLTIQYKSVCQEFIYQTNHWKIDERMRSSRTHCLFKDSKGFIWIGTEEGVYRFDGYKFKFYQKSLEGQSPFAIFAINEDQEGNIWLQTAYDSQSPNQILILKKGENELSFSENIFSSETEEIIRKGILFCETPLNKAIWFKDRNENIYKYENSRPILVFKSREVTDNDASIQFNDVITIKEVHGEKSNINTLDSLGNIILEKQVNFVTAKNAIDHRQTSWYYEADNQLAERIDRRKIYYSHHGENAIHDYPIKENHLKEYSSVDFNINGDYIYIVNTFFLHIYHKDKGWTKSINLNSSNLHHDQNSSTTKILVDEDQIWTASNNQLTLISKQPNLFDTHLGEYSLRGILQLDSNSLLINSYTGLIHFDLNTNSIQKTPNYHSGLEFLRTNDEKVLIGRYGHFVSQLDLKTNEYIDIAFQTSWNPMSGGKTLFQDKKTNRIWAGGTSSVWYLDQEKQVFMPYKKVNGFKNFESETINSFYENDSGIWISTSNGIYLLVHGHGIKEHYDLASGHLPFNDINFIHEDKEDNTFWLGSNGGGLIHWKPGKKEYKQYKGLRYLSDNRINAVYEDKNNKLWLPTFHGLTHFNKSTKESRYYFEKDGISNNEFNRLSHCKLQDGRYLFGGINGLTIFNPEDFKAKKNTTPLRSTSIEIFNPSTNLLEDYTTTFQSEDKIVLPNKRSYTKIHFSLLDFDQIEGNHFVYKVSTIDDDWKFIYKPPLTLYGLPYGNSKVLIRGKNANGEWASQQLELKVEVLRPFYLKWWFILCSLAAAILFYFGTVRWRTYLLKKKNQELEEEIKRRTAKIEQDKIFIQEQAEKLKKLDEAKSKLFSNISHELKTPLTLIKGPIEQLIDQLTLNGKQEKLIGLIQNNTNQLQKLIDQILDLTRLNSSKLTLDETSGYFLSFLKGIIETYEYKAKRNKINYHSSIELDDDLVLSFDKDKIEKILNNLISNAIKFTPSSKSVSIIAQLKGANMVIQVIDSGIGVKKEEQDLIFQRYYQSSNNSQNSSGGLGIGLSLSYELAQFLGGDLTLVSHYNKGSNFTFSFPAKIVTNHSYEIEKIQPKESEIVEKITFQTSNPPKEKPLILIVEDNLDMQHYIAGIFEDSYQIALANNGKIAMEMLNKQSQQVDLMISDVMMPEMDGFTLIKQVKEHPKLCRLPILMLTAKAEPENVLFGLNAGIDDYVSKPFGSKELKVRVNNILHNIQLRNKSLDGQVLLSNNSNLEPADLKWLKEVEKMASQLLDQQLLSISFLANNMHLSERQFNRKIKEITGNTPLNYLRELKLQKARILIDTKAFKTVAEVSHSIGFSNPKYFSTLYKKRFGKSPSQVNS